MRRKQIRTPQKSNDLKYFNNSLARGLEILAAFSTEQPSMTVSEIAVAVGLPQSTVFRLVTTLEHLGYLDREEETKRYRHSSKMLTLGLAALKSMDLRNLALPYMQALSQRTNETVKLAILDKVEVVILASVVVREKLSVPTPVGYRMPAYCAALGKALLAFQPIGKWGALLKLIDFKPRTKTTITTPEKFRTELTRIRARGYAISNQEMIVGESSIAAPICNQNGEAIAAINISTLLFAVEEDDRANTLIQEIVACARQISKELELSEAQQGSAATVLVHEKSSPR